jgi:hypothetical protein
MYTRVHATSEQGGDGGGWGVAFLLNSEGPPLSRCTDCDAGRKSAIELIQAACPAWLAVQP